MLQELHGRGVLVLITSRRSLGITLGMAAQPRLGALSAEAGIDMLSGLAGRGVRWGAQEAESLVHKCGCNPLAIKVMAGFLSGEKITPEVRTSESNLRDMCAQQGL